MCLIISGSGLAYAKTKVVGTVYDSETSMPIEGVHVIAPKFTSRISNSKGFFTIEFNGLKEIELTFSHTAYITKRIKFYTAKKDSITVFLDPKVIVVSEFEITSSKNDFQNNVSGLHSLSSIELSRQPAIMGEPDIMQAVRALPGVQSVNEGVSGLLVRGGSAGHNAFELDGIELLNPFHLIGTFSTFNSLLTENVDVYKGSAPVHLHSKLSSSIIVTTKHFPDTVSPFEINIGTLSSNFTYRGTSVNKKLYYALGIRRTFMELYKPLAGLFIPEDKNFFSSTMYSFYDFNGKVNYRFTKGILSLSFYSGKDKFKMSSLMDNFDAGINWGNRGSALTYTHAYSPEFSSKHVLSYGDFKFNYKGNILFRDVQFNSKYERINLHNVFTLSKQKHHIRFGVDISSYNITPQFLSFSVETSENTKIERFYNVGVDVFFGDSYQVSNRLSFYGGLKAHLFNQLGPYSYYDTEKGELIKNIESGEIVKSYFDISPVLHATYNTGLNSKLRLSYSHNYQNIHLGSIATIPLPADIWMPSSSFVEPESCHQLTAGYYYKNTSKDIEVSLELFGRKYLNQLIFIPNINPSEFNNFEDHFISGIAQSAGFELLLKKHFLKGDLQLAYTFSKALSKYEALNDNHWFDSKFDRPHDLNLTFTYELSSKIKASANWVFASGNKTTLPEQAYWQMGYLMMHNDVVNNYRYPAYHRLDVGIDYKLRSRWFNSSILNLSVVNVYNRANPYFLFFQSYLKESRYQVEIKAMQVSLFPILPSLSWRIKF